MGKLFGTDGIRGKFNEHPMTPSMGYAFGRAVAVSFRKRGTDGIIIGRDTRESGPALEAAVALGVCSAGITPLLAGVLPTPGIAFLVRKLRASAGVVISASHNPWRDNGLKVFSPEGFKLSERVEKRIENNILKNRTDCKKLFRKPVQAKRIKDATDKYISFCKSTAACRFNGLRVVLDCANGATHATAPLLFKKLGARVTVINNKPSGRNINADCGSEHPGKLINAVRKTRSDVGFAFDGDGDRVAAVDEKGQLLTGDHLMAILASFFKRSGRLQNNLLVSTIMSNIGLKVAMKDIGIKCLDAGVGDRQVLELMLKKVAFLGGEQSGHIIMLDRHTTGDGILAALQIAGVVKQTGKKLSQLASIMRHYPQQLINVPVARKPPLGRIPALQKAISYAQKVLGKKGRILVRYSGTQNICRVMVEGPTKNLTSNLATVLADEIRKVVA